LHQTNVDGFRDWKFSDLKFEVKNFEMSNFKLQKIFKDLNWLKGKKTFSNLDLCLNKKIT
jgi:hypothetical protein